jgi:hypothetical protein
MNATDLTQLLKSAGKKRQKRPCNMCLWTALISMLSVKESVSNIKAVTCHDHPSFCTAEFGYPGGTYELSCM